MNKKDDKKIKLCDHPSCKEKGLYKAPKNRNLKEYYHFCLKHVKEYNKTWDYYKGMTSSEIDESLKSASLWEKPTWKVGAKTYKEIFDDKNTVHNPFNLFSDIFNQKNDKPKMTDNEEDAIKTFGIEFPFTEVELKKRYKILVKKYHPDTAKNKKQAETKFKEITKAYQILKNI